MNTTPQKEWLYLVNETLTGEKAIVPLLKHILEEHRLGSGLKAALEQQLEEEINHVRGYYKLVGKEGLRSSGYDLKLDDYVRNLPKASLKLFALQGMLEGIALGALNHRLQYWKNSPSYAFDLRAHLEESGHVVMSFDFFNELKEEEGSPDISEFRQIEKDVNKIFVNSFQGNTLVEFIKNNFGEGEAEHLSSKSIENSTAMKCFRRKSAETLVRTKNGFLQHFFGA